MEIREKAAPHTLKKFELIETYTKRWARKLLGYPKCDTIVFTDCMCNSGLYTVDGKDVVGTPIRVSWALSKIMQEECYKDKRAILIFNDKDEDKIVRLKSHLPDSTLNFKIELHNMDANELLRQMAKKWVERDQTHTLIVYDPFTASIDWDALSPFMNNWGEVIINHMVSDTIRAIHVVSRENAINKYQTTYRASIEQLAQYVGKEDYINRIEEIIQELNSRGTKYYIAAFPFYTRNNSYLYQLIHFTRNKIGFQLFKEVAWKTFGDKSSMKISKINSDQFTLFGEDDAVETTMILDTDEECYTVHDIAKYLTKAFRGRKGVQFDEIWKTLEQHPVFPANAYRKEIRSNLSFLGNKVYRYYVDFN